MCLRCVFVYVCVHPPPILQGVSGKVETSVEQSPGRTERTGRRRAVSMGGERTKEEKGNRIESQRDIKRSRDWGKYQVSQTREKQWERAAEQKERHGAAECGDIVHEGRHWF